MVSESEDHLNLLTPAKHLNTRSQTFSTNIFKIDYKFQYVTQEAIY